MARGTFTWNGQSSDDYDIIVRRLPALASPEERVKVIEIPGRDGHLTVPDGSVAGCEMKIECTLADYSKREEIFAWLRGAGELVTSERPLYKVKARVSNKIEPAYVSPGIKDFVVYFRAQPYLYEATPTYSDLTSTGTIDNIGTVESLPTLVVYGEGTLTVNGTELTVAATVGEDYVTIDCDAEECSYQGNSRNAKVSGGFPTLKVGSNDVTIGAGITSVRIYGNWRWY